MNTRFKAIFLNVGILISIILSSCGGGSGSIGGIDGSGAPAVAGTVSTGSISGFGSVIVNGVHFNSDKAAVLINDEMATENDLRTGYQVKITGAINKDGTAVANTIEFSPNILGAIEAINTTNQQLTVLGHQVQISSETLFDSAINPNSLKGLKIGDIILVSGFANEKEIITATRIELSASQTRQIKGNISGINPASFTFKIKDLIVNYSAASLKNVGGNLANDNQVVVIGSLDAQGVLQAKTIVKINNSLSKDVKTVEAQGFITRFASAADFDVAGIAWSTDSQTQFEEGNREKLALGVAVNVKGNLTASGVALANKVEFKRSAPNEIEGEVTSITPQSGQDITTGTLQINGINILTNAKTAFEDKGAAKLKRFGFNNINTGDFLKISGYSNQGNFIATKIERRDIKTESSTEIELNGIISNIGSNNFTLYGRIVFTNSSTRIKDTNSKEITEAQFYAQALGKRVEVEGILKNGIFTASSIKFEKGD